MRLFSNGYNDRLICGENCLKLQMDRSTVNLRLNLLVLLALLVMLAVLWQPFGFKTLGLVEEWSNLTQVESGIPMLNAEALLALRPFALLSFALGYALTPGSFVGLNFLLLLLFFLKGAVVYHLTRCLFSLERSFALLTAALFILYPADSELFALRSISTHFALLAYLLAVELLVRFWRRPNRLTLVAMGLCQCLSLLSYELGFPLIILTPVILFWLARKSSYKQRTLRVTAFWYVVPVVCAIFDVSQLARVPNTYQSGLLSSSAAVTIGQNLTEIFRNLIRAYQQNFWGGWETAISQLPGSPYVLNILLIGLIMGSVCVLLFRHEELSPPRIRIHLLLFCSGLVILAVAFAPYLLSSAHRGLNARVFYYSSLGAALSVAAGLWLITRVFPHLIWLSIMSGLVMVAAVSSFGQKQELQDYAHIQQRLLGGIAEQVGSLDSETVLLIFDPSYTFRATHWLYAFGDYILEDSLRYLYQLPVAHAAFCFPDSLASRGIKDECEFSPDYVRISSPLRPVQSYPYSQVIGLSWDNWSETLSILPSIPPEFVLPSGSVSGYDPERLIRKTEPPTSRLYTLLTHWPDSQPTPRPLQHRLVFEFNQSVPGIGWAAPQGENTWTTQKDAVFWCRLVPDADYTIQFRASALTEAVLNSLTLQVNGVPIPLASHWDSYFQIFTGTIPHSVIARNTNRTEIVFQVDRILSPKQLGTSDDIRQLGLLLNWLHIEPQSN